MENLLMKLHQKTSTSLFLLLLLTLSTRPAPAQSTRDFQVATIKPSAPGTERVTQIRGNRFATEGTTLLDLLLYAYSVHPSQIIGGPDWLRTEKFDLLADPETDQRPSSPEMKAMVARLLGERFHLVLRREQQQLPVYALVPTGSGIKFKPTEGEAKSSLTATGGFIPPGTLAVRNGTLNDLAAFLQRFAPTEVTRPVVDQTGIAGHFDFDLHFTPLSPAQHTQAAEPDTTPNLPPPLFTAIQEQLGLKLEPTRAPIEVLRVESVTEPSAN